MINKMENKYSIQQIETFEELWFIYGNRGRKHTMFNHKLVQGFIEAGEDRREAYKRGRKGDNRAHLLKIKEEIHVTDECIKVVGLVLENKFQEAMELAKS